MIDVFGAATAALLVCMAASVTTKLALAFLKAKVPVTVTRPNRSSGSSVASACVSGPSSPSMASCTVVPVKLNAAAVLSVALVPSSVLTKSSTWSRTARRPAAEASSTNTFSHPAASRSRRCAARPAAWSAVDVRA